MEWGVNDEKISGGLMQPCTVNERPEWDKYSRQGVFFLPEGLRTNANLRELCNETVFDPVSGEISFRFH
jgi:hypothetical protein